MQVFQSETDKAKKPRLIYLCPENGRIRGLSVDRWSQERSTSSIFGRTTNIIPAK